jgi:hypothetical protein
VYDVDEMKALGITLCLGLKIFKKSLLNFNGSFFIDYMFHNRNTFENDENLLGV